MMKWLKVPWFIVLICSAFSVQGKPESREGQLVQDTQVVNAPSHQAKPVILLKKDQQVQVQQRQQAWYQVLTETDVSGWVKMLAVKLSPQAKRVSETGVASLWSSITSGKSDSTVSTGIRGFDEADLKKATANPEQVALLATFSRTPEQTKLFAQQGGLTARDIDLKQATDGE